MEEFNKREDIIHFIKNEWVVAELGVFKGDFSKILSNAPLKELHLVDPFFGVVCSGDKKGENVQFLDGSLLYNEVSTKFKSDHRVVIHRTTSDCYLNSLDNNSIDMVYIDTTHEYIQTKMELELSRSKVKNGGLICGHDYNQSAFPGVFRAVNEFLETYNLNMILTNEDFLESFIITNIKP